MAAASLNVGIYFDLRNPARWAQDPARLHSFTLEMCEEAERLGAHSIWTTEHHLFDDGYVASPLTFLSAVAARTSRVRLGSAIVIAPLHHPAEIAEQAALVDLISDGRLDLGLGTGYRVPEFALYNASMDRRYGQTDQCACELRRLLGPNGVTPRPVQQPVPIWMGYQGPQGAGRAGRLGAGLLSADGRLWGPYRAGLSDAGHDPSTARMAGAIQAWASEDPERDWPLVAEHLGHQLDSYGKHMVEGTGRPAPAPVDPDRIRARDHNARIVNYFWCETPDEIARRTRDFVGDSPAETVFFWASIAGMGEAMVANNIQTICTKLAPLLRETTQYP